MLNHLKSTKKFKGKKAGMTKSFKLGLDLGKFDFVS